MFKKAFWKIYNVFRKPREFEFKNTQELLTYSFKMKHGDVVTVKQIVNTDGLPCNSVTYEIVDMRKNNKGEINDR